MERIVELIKHPERLDRDTLYELRSLLALYPYYQTVRLLMLQNLYLLHDPTFDEELRRAAIYITDRKMLFNLVEAPHYQLRKVSPMPTTKPVTSEPETTDQKEDRTISLIDNFLGSIPKDEEKAPEEPKRKPTPADAAVDYVAYLLETEGEFLNSADSQTLRDILTVNGHSMSHPILDSNGEIDMDASRRVEVKFRLKDEEMIEELRSLME